MENFTLRQSFTAKVTKGAKENNSLAAKDTKDAEEHKSLNAEDAEDAKEYFSKTKDAKTTPSEVVASARNTRNA